MSIQYYHILYKNVAVGITLIMGKITLLVWMNLSLDANEVQTET